MLVLYVFSLFILHSSFINGFLTFDSDIEHTLFGNITTLRDLFINETDEGLGSRRNQQDDDSWLDDKYQFEEIFPFEKNASNHSHDISDYNVVMDKLRNMTSLYHEQSRRSIYIEPGENMTFEEYKKSVLVNINIQFSMHVRYEVGKALAQREEIRNDRRYKLGYLFNRMRRLQTEQIKIVAAAIIQNNSHDDFRLSSMIRSYERVVHLDVDMRDTARYIKELFDAKEPYDFYIKIGGKKRFSGDKRGPGYGPIH